MRRDYKPLRFRNRPLSLLLASVLLGTGCAGTVAEQATDPPRSPKAYVGNFKDNTLSVIDTTAKRVLSTIPMPPGPHGLVITPNGRWVYVSSDGASTVSVIDTATDKVVENIEVGKNPHGLAVTPDGSLVLVAVYDTNSVAFVDSATRRVVGSVAIGRPHNIAMHPNGTGRLRRFANSWKVFFGRGRYRSARGNDQHSVRKNSARFGSHAGWKISISDASRR